jgi:hypothetical protein
MVYTDSTLLKMALQTSGAAMDGITINYLETLTKIVPSDVVKAAKAKTKWSETFEGPFKLNYMLTAPEARHGQRSDVDDGSTPAGQIASLCVYDYTPDGKPSSGCLAIIAQPEPASPIMVYTDSTMLMMALQTSGAAMDKITINYLQTLTKIVPSEVVTKAKATAKWKGDFKGPFKLNYMLTAPESRHDQPSDKDRSSADPADDLPIPPPPDADPPTKKESYRQINRSPRILRLQKGGSRVIRPISPRCQMSRMTSRSLRCPRDDPVPGAAQVPKEPDS